MGLTNLLEINQFSADSVRVSNYVFIVVFEQKNQAVRGRVYVILKRPS